MTDDGRNGVEAMYYAFDRQGRLYTGEASEEHIRHMAELYECEVQVWSHSIEHNDAQPLFYYDANGVKHTHNDGDN